MKELRITEKISRNKVFNSAVKERKERLIQQAIDLYGSTVKGSYDFHIKWVSSDRNYKVGVGKFGKEYYLQTISWKNGLKGNNPNDMRPTIWKDGNEIEFDGSFDHVFNFFQQVSKIDTKALEILGCLMFRNAYMLDHDDELNYCPPQEAIDYLNSVIPTYEGISVEAYLHYLEMIAWNEDVKYSTLGYDIHTGIGRKNNMLTYAHIIAILLGKGSLSKLCSQFSRPPVGVSPISQALAKEAFPQLELEL
jgi:hypothetical protein